MGHAIKLSVTYAETLVFTACASAEYDTHFSQLKDHHQMYA